MKTRGSKKKTMIILIKNKHYITINPGFREVLFTLLCITSLKFGKYTLPIPFSGQYYAMFVNHFQ